MKILFNHTLRSIRDNLGQLVIIILTVTVVSMLFFVTLTIGGLFENVQTSIQARLGKNSDVTVSATVFSSAKLEEFCDIEDVEYVEKYLQTGGLYKPANATYSKTVLVEGTNLSDYATRHGSELKVFDKYEYSSDYPEVWIGRSFAEENGIKAGDTLQIYLEMYNTYRTLTVNYIFENYGIFANNVVNNVLIDLKTVGNKGLISTANIKLKEGVDKEEFMTALSQYMGDEATVTESVDYAEIDRVVGSNQRLLRITLVFVTALMIFILFTSFLVVAKKRIYELTVFRTVGATNSQIALMLIFEGMFYGFTGAILGAIMGRIGMGIAVNKVIPNFPDAVTFRLWHYIVTVLFGVAVSTVSAVFPIIKAGKEAVRTATGDTAKAVRKNNPLPLILSAVFLVISAVLTAILSNILIVVLLVVCSAIFIYFVTPYLLLALSKLFCGKGISSLAGMTIKRNPSGRTLAGTVGAIVLFAFVVVSVVEIIIGASVPAPARFEADFVVDSVISVDKQKIADEINGMFGVDSSYLYVYDTCIWQKDTQNREYTVYGVDDSTALKAMMNLSEEENTKFDTTLNPVVITYDLSKRFGIEIGDVINITLGTKEQTGKTLYNDFTVVGIDDTVTANDRIMAIRKDSFNIDGRKFTPSKSIIFINTEKNVPTNDLYSELRDKVEQNSCYILELNDWAYATSVGITGITLLLRLLQILVGVVAIAGVINLTFVMIMGRSREYEIFRWTGLDSKKYTLLSVFEGLIISLVGTCIGVVLSVIVNVLIPDFAQIIDRFIVYTVFPWQLAVIAGIFVVGYTLVYCITAKIINDKSLKSNNKSFKTK